MSCFVGSKGKQSTVNETSRFCFIKHYLLSQLNHQLQGSSDLQGLGPEATPERQVTDNLSYAGDCSG